MGKNSFTDNIVKIDNERSKLMNYDNLWVGVAAISTIFIPFAKTCPRAELATVVSTFIAICGAYNVGCNKSKRKTLDNLYRYNLCSNYFYQDMKYGNLTGKMSKNDEASFYKALYEHQRNTIDLVIIDELNK